MAWACADRPLMSSPVQQEQQYTRLYRQEEKQRRTESARRRTQTTAAAHSRYHHCVTRTAMALRVTFCVTRRVPSRSRPDHVGRHRAECSVNADLSCRISGTTLDLTACLERLDFISLRERSDRSRSQPSEGAVHRYRLTFKQSLPKTITACRVRAIHDSSTLCVEYMLIVAETGQTVPAASIGLGDHGSERRASDTCMLTTELRLMR